MPPKNSSAQFYKKSELDRARLGARCEETLGVKPFGWQLDAGCELLCGGDVVLDAGCGCGKSVVFQLPLLLDETSISLVMLPLSALMLEQANNSKLKTVAVCSETIEEVGRDELYRRIIAGNYQLVLISPEIAVSPHFTQEILSKHEFSSRLRAVCVDEAHCINIWGGGGFRPDYAALGSLRGRIPRNVPFLVASATFPTHVLDDVRSTLSLAQDALTISVTNDRPNVALSVRVMKHSNEDKADLRFVIPEGARTLEDIPITAIYCSERLMAEQVADEVRKWAREQGIEGGDESIVFYHSKVGSRRKREIEELLRKGKVRVICCTNAVGMGCDLRNIDRAVLWGLPSTFCALVQRAGRAMRDMSKDGEAILIITKATKKRAVKDLQVLEQEIAASAQAALVDETGNDFAAAVADAVGDHGELRSVEEAGARVSVAEAAAGSSRKGKCSQRGTKTTFNSREAHYLILFIRGDRCRRGIWNEFFGNQSKLQLEDPAVSLFRRRGSLRCCDICEPDKFPIEDVVVTKEKGLTQGRKQKLPPALGEQVRSHLQKWRDNDLLGSIHGIAAPSLVTISGNAYLGDDVIEKICNSGIYLRTEEQFLSNVRWGYGVDEDTGKLNGYGNAQDCRRTEMVVVINK